MKEKDEIQLMLDGMPMTNYQICFCCHTVRGCKGCCNKCEHECSNKHDCELPLKPDSTWLNGIITCFKKEYWIYPKELIKEKKK